MKKELTKAEVACIRRALKHFQNWLGIRGKPHGADAPPQPNGQKTMITIAEEQICGGCEHHVYHFSPISQDYDYYTCRLHRCPSKCNQGINN